MYNVRWCSKLLQANRIDTPPCQH